MRRTRAVALALGVASLTASVLATRAAQAQPPERQQKKLSIWQSNKNTFFVASASDVGIVYVRPHVLIGWGAPFWQLIGIDAYAVTSISFAAAYAGWRANLPWFDVQFGGRTVYAYDRRFLPRKRTYTAEDLPLGYGDQRSQYSLAELEIVAVAPILHGFLFTEIHPMWVDAPRHLNVYEEVARVVMEPPFVMRTRLGFVYGLGKAMGTKLGAMAEYVVTPGRPSNTLRLGPVATVALSDTLEILATYTGAVSSPDQLGLYESSYGYLGLRYRYAKRF